MIPGMISAGYRKDDAAAVSATGGTLGILIPPSNPMIIYGVVANCSIAGLFMAGFIPGFVLTTLLCLTAYAIARKRGYTGTGEKFTLRALFKAIWDGKWSLATPVIILGGIYGGIFTPTEAAEVGVLWTLFVGLIIYRKLSWKNISSALVRTSAFAGSATILVGVSMAFSRLLTLYQIPQSVGHFLASISTDPTITLLLIALFIFACGFIADTLAMVVVLAPVFLPITNSLGIHPIQLGILFVVCCETGFLTPPFGSNLFVTMKITDVKLEEVALQAAPYLIAMWILIFIVAAFPKFVMFLPNLVFG
jgi:C4-dicarboxylate transporter DctM subunit